ncbi:MAG: thiol:disulfide interchange protein DsbA/DsbL, partial [Hafnia alvei]
EAVKNRLDEMSAITDFYDITATPIFIINKRFVVAQDSSFPEFSKRMLNLLGKDK